MAPNQKDGAFPEPIRDLAWDYGDHADPHRVARELNGRYLVDVTDKDGKSFAAGKQVSGFAELRERMHHDVRQLDLLRWLHRRGNLAARRDMTDAPNGIGLYPKWSWVWPMNRRILYNRASVNRKGEPFQPAQWAVPLDDVTWEGDVPDGGMPPGEVNPFIMLASGVGQLYSPDLVDGPFPEHYEPVESPVKNPFSKIQSSPCAQIPGSPANSIATANPMSFRLSPRPTESPNIGQNGAMSRNMPWLVGLVPNAFAEIGTALAKREGIKNGGTR